MNGDALPKGETNFISWAKQQKPDPLPKRKYSGQYKIEGFNFLFAHACLL